MNLLLLALIWLAARRDARTQRKLAKTLTRRSDELAFLNEMNNSLLSCVDQDEANGVITHYLALILPGTAGALYLHRASRDALVLQAAWGDGDTTFVTGMFKDECWGQRRGRMHVRHDRTDLACAHSAGYEGGSLCVPMMALGDTIGMLHVRPTHDELEVFFDQEHLRLAETAATQIASAMANLGLREAMRAQSIRDPLTGLFNRRYLEESMQREEVRARRENAPLSLVMLDVDHFKAFNDQHGHRAGDQVLRSLGQLLTHAVRGDDIACRYGGEEFTLVMPGASAEKAAQRAEHLRAQIERMKVSIDAGPLPPVTASFGVAAIPTHGDGWRPVLQAADVALYRAKHDGRNRVASADPVSGSDHPAS